jgi:Host cell surface-exposed lipoprotein
MSEQFAHLTGGPAAGPKPTPEGWRAPEPQKPKGKHPLRKVVLWTAALGTVTLIGVAIGAATSKDNPAPAQHPAASQWNPDGSSKAASSPGSNPFSDSDPSNDPNYQPPASHVDVPEPTVAQEQALESAKSYLDMGGFSRAGLIDQLHSSAGEGFKMADAKWAVNHAHANWNHQAVLSAKSYLDMGGFSRASLIDQLSSSAGEGFTLAQATYAANQVGL